MGPVLRGAHRRLTSATARAVVGTFTLGAISALAVAESPPQPPPPVRKPGFVDIHVHTAGLGHGDSGAFISRAMRESFKFGIYLRAFGVTEEALEAEGDGLIVQGIARQVAASEQVSQAVVLALDGIIGDDGTLDRERTALYVPNDFVARETAKYPNLLFGASINPKRADALARLERAHGQGAVLVKWIPAIMGFDPADVAFDPFYRRMRELGIVLLTHGGQERAFGEADDRLGDPRKLRRALAHGVTVVVAHLATTGEIEGKDYFYHLLPMFDDHPNLYAEISSLTQINKRGYLFEALRTSALHPRLLYGSDWPLQFFPLVWAWYQFPDLAAGEIRRIGAIENVWDRDVELKRAMGVPGEVFERTARILGVAR